MSWPPSELTELAEAAEPPAKKKKGGKLKKLVLFTGLAAGLGFAAKKLQGKKTADNWQSSYVPTPPPATPTSSPASSTTATQAAPAAPATPAAPMSGTPAADAADDSAGSSPDEALADQAEAPHEVTTPDDPAEVVEIKGNNAQHKKS